MSRLKVGVVGVGALGRHHARILAGLDSVELVAVADVSTERGRPVAESCGANWFADYRDLFSQIEAVSIAVPTTAHLAVAAEFLQRRIPVLVEKPLACNVEQATQLVELAEEQRTLLQVGHVERFNPATEAAWKHTGPPKYIRAERLSPYTFRSTDIGVVHDLMIHDLDLVLDLVRAPLYRVEAFGVSIMGKHEDTVQARLIFENGAIADLTANRVCPTPRRNMQLWSHTGCVTVDFTTREVVCYRPSDTLLYGASPLDRASQSGADIEQLKRDVFGSFVQIKSLNIGTGDALTAELESFVECVRSNGRPVVGGREALAAMLAAGHILDCVASHQWDGQADGAIGPFARTPGRRKLSA
jgi:predicted dehydrogenase